VEREQEVERLRQRLGDDLTAHGLRAQVQGRPKHIYSIWKKMSLKGLDFGRVLDVRALRVIVADVPDCYAVLGRVHELFRAVPGELDDYIARPKANGYQSLHTVVEDEHGRVVEIQIRTTAMHAHAEHGISAHWAYKEAGQRGKAGVSARGTFETSVAEARMVVLRQLLAWERDYSEAESGEHPGRPADTGLFETASMCSRLRRRSWSLRPARHRSTLPTPCTPTWATDAEARRSTACWCHSTHRLRSGQVVEITAAKAGGPSMDWLNSELGYLQSQRSKAKVRAWFNALALQSTISRGREAVEKLLQREGKTAIKLDELAGRLGFKNADALFEVVGKDEYSLRNVETLLRPTDISQWQTTGFRSSGPGRRAARAAACWWSASTRC
jgi:GTP pyrophosphokinase